MRLKPIQPLGATSPVAARCGWLGFRKLLSHACLLVLLLAFCLRVALPVRATARTQAAPSLEILNIENREFPLIRVEVKPRNLPIGSAAPIVTNAFTILENGNSVPTRNVRLSFLAGRTTSRQVHLRSAHILVLFSQGYPGMMMLPVSSFHSLPAAPPFPRIAPSFAACLSLKP